MTNIGKMVYCYPEIALPLPQGPRTNDNQVTASNTQLSQPAYVCFHTPTCSTEVHFVNVCHVHVHITVVQCRAYEIHTAII